MIKADLRAIENPAIRRGHHDGPIYLRDMFGWVEHHYSGFGYEQYLENVRFTKTTLCGTEFAQQGSPPYRFRPPLDDTSEVCRRCRIEQAKQRLLGGQPS